MQLLPQIAERWCQNGFARIRAIRVSILSESLGHKSHEWARIVAIFEFVSKTSRTAQNPAPEPRSHGSGQSSPGPSPLSGVAKAGNTKHGTRNSDSSRSGRTRRSLEAK